ncbi:hypothetical protein [Gimesia sp.]
MAPVCFSYNSARNSGGS